MWSLLQHSTVSKTPGWKSVFLCGKSTALSRLTKLGTLKSRAASFSGLLFYYTCLHVCACFWHVFEPGRGAGLHRAISLGPQPHLPLLVRPAGSDPKGGCWIVAPDWARGRLTMLGEVACVCLSACQHISRAHMWYVSKGGYPQALRPWLCHGYSSSHPLL